jgi:hypothetical protein
MSSPLSSNRANIESPCFGELLEMVRRTRDVVPKSRARPQRSMRCLLHVRVMMLHTDLPVDICRNAP